MKNQSEKPLIGWLCSYTPEEILIAAGFEPRKLFGEAEGSSQADAYIYSNICPYIKSILGNGLQGKLDHLKGLVLVNSCDAMRKLYDLWRAYIKIPYTYFLDVPKNQDEKAIYYFATQLRKFARNLEENFDTRIDNESLNKAIKQINRNRILMGKIYEQMKNINSNIDGKEVFELGLEGLKISKEEFHNKLLNYYNKKIKNIPGTEKKKTRVLISGNVLDQTQLLHILEKAGVNVVGTDICTGIRYYSGIVEEDTNDPIFALAHRYINKFSCARMTGLVRRYKYLDDLVKEYSVDGVIYISVKFCDQYLYDAPFFIEKLEKNKIPVLFLENEYKWDDTPQMRTRVEAFIEQIKQ